MWRGLCLLCLISLPLQAEIFKCTVHGQTEFSDKPCAEQAEKVELKVIQPQQSDVDEQQAITRTFREESRINDIHILKQRNVQLEADIRQLQQSHDEELKLLRDRTQLTDDGYMVTSEYGLFDEMNALTARYQQQIEQIQSEIEHNERRLQVLHNTEP
jgi:SMC interacting uncharacterized protein involved in chromosome segregation